MIDYLKTIPSIIVASKISRAKNNTNYATITIKNPKGSASVNIWGVGEKNPFKVGDSVFFPKITEKDGFYSTKFTDCVLQDTPKDSPLRDYLPRVVTESEWNNLSVQLASLMKPKEGDILKEQMAKLYQPYSCAQAARANHHAFPGGLLQHTYELLNVFKGIFQVCPFPVNPFIVAMASLYHDFGKLSEYTKDMNYTQSFFLKGHPSISSESVGRVLRTYDLDSDIIEHIQHCVLAHHGKLEWGAPVLPATPEAFLVAKLDELSGHGVMYGNAENGQSVPNLGTTIFKYSYE